MSAFLPARSLVAADPVTTYPAGRVCACPECETVLSVYNPSGYCGLHQPEPDMHYCGMAFKVCQSCGLVQQARSFLKAPADGKVICRKCQSEQEIAARKAASEPTHKACPKCGEVKPITSHFWVMRTTSDGRQVPHSRCRACKSRSDAARYAARKQNREARA
jgi:hypothetical protein